MDARVVQVTEADWPVVSRYLVAMEEGAILFSPVAAKEFKERTGHSVPDGDLVEYAFDPPNVFLDVVYGTEMVGDPEDWHHGAEVARNHVLGEDGDAAA